jgi:hypothetical protein
MDRRERIKNRRSIVDDDVEETSSVLTYRSIVPVRDGCYVNVHRYSMMMDHRNVTFDTRSDVRQREGDRLGKKPISK